MATKILIGGPIRQDPEVLDAHLTTLKALKTPKGTTLDFAFINDADEGAFDVTTEHISGMGAVAFLPSTRPDDAHYTIGTSTHEWSTPTFEHLAIQKQRLLQYAIDNGYTHTFLVDSDLLLDPMTLVSLHSLKVPLASAVFWTAWNRGNPPMPQVWLRHPYGLEGFGMDGNTFLRRLGNREVLQVLGGGACHLIDTNALSKVHYHPRIENLPTEGMWQGEDRTFAITAERAHIPQYADGWPDIYHAYHPHQRTKEALEAALGRVMAPRQSHASYGDLVAFTIDTLQDPKFAAAIHPTARAFRGRLGGIKMLPEIEDALLDMAVGDSRPLELHHPPWSSLSELANKRTYAMLNLIDIKPHSYAPVVEEVIHGTA